MSLMSSLPDEILSYIATFLTPMDLKACNVVSIRFCAICRDYSLWRRFFVDLNTSSCPNGRLCHTGVVNSNKMYIFGGHITQQPSSEYFHTVKQDLYECDLVTRQWREVEAGDLAPKRTEHTAIVYNNTMVVFGGYSGNGYESSVMVFDFAVSKWKQLETKGDTPSARSAHTAVVAGDCMYVFGGWNGVRCMNDLYELNFTTNTWSLISADTTTVGLSGAHVVHASDRAVVTGDAPSARCSHGAIAFTEGGAKSMFVFGGYAIEGANESANRGYLDDLHEFNFSSMKWTQHKTRGPAPGPRSRFRMISYKDSIYLFAGWNSSKHFSTLYRYSIANNLWTEIETNFDSDGIGQFSMVEYDGIMYVFSGFSPKAGCRTNLFAYPLAPVLCRQAQ